MIRYHERKKRENRRIESEKKKRKTNLFFSWYVIIKYQNISSFASTLVVFCGLLNKLYIYLSRGFYYHSDNL